MDVQTLPLAEIVADHDLQPRVNGIDGKHVRELEAGAEHWPPISVVPQSGRFVLVDGFHRLHAAKNLKLQSIRATVLKVPDHADLHALAFTLNASHGRSLSLMDRRAFAARLLCLNPSWSDREIGRQSGLAQPTINKIRTELERQKQIPAAQSRIGRDGRSYAVARQYSLKSWATRIEEIVDAADSNEQRRIVRYLQKLAPLLAEQAKFKGFNDAAQACVTVLGEKRAKELAQRIGWSGHNIFEIARTLGYREGAQP
ncbi:MAG: ParB/RepB/Spo0J family partition protein [Rhizomicrobium sp.]